MGIVKGQTVRFEQQNQFFNLKEDIIKVKIIIDQLDKYPKNELIYLQLSSDLKDFTIIGVTDVQTMTIVIDPSQDSNSKEIHLRVNKENINTLKSITLRLLKVNPKSNFSIIPIDHTIILEKEKELKSTIGFLKSNNGLLDIDFLNITKFRIPYQIKVKGYSPLSDDDIKIDIKIKNSGGYIDGKTHIIIGGESLGEIIITKKDDPSRFDKMLELVGDETTTDLELEIINVTNGGKKNIILELDKENKTIRYNLKKKIKKGEGRYNFFLGTNFDLEERFETTSFYAEIEANVPMTDKFNLRAGAFKNNYTTSLEEERSQRPIFEITNTTSDSISYTEKRVSSAPNVSIENWGLYVDIMKNIGSSRFNNNFKLYLSGHIEVVQRIETYSFNDTDLLTFSQSTISLDSLASNPKLQSLLTVPKRFTRKYADSYFGIGLPMSYISSDANFELFINPFGGVGSPGLTYTDKNGKKVEDTIRPFGAVQFYLIAGINQKIGVRVGGEVRKYFRFAQNPTIIMNLSTNLDLDSIIGKNKTNPSSPDI